MGESVLTVRPWKPHFLCSTQVATVSLNLPALGIPGLAKQKSGASRKWKRGGHSMADMTEGTICLWGVGRTPDTHLERGEGQVQLAFLLASGGWFTILMFIYLAELGLSCGI